MESTRPVSSYNRADTTILINSGFPEPWFGLVVYIWLGTLISLPRFSEWKVDPFLPPCSYSQSSCSVYSLWLPSGMRSLFLSEHRNAQLLRHHPPRKSWIGLWMSWWGGRRYDESLWNLSLLLLSGMNGSSCCPGPRVRPRRGSPRSSWKICSAAIRVRRPDQRLWCSWRPFQVSQDDSSSKMCSWQLLPARGAASEPAAIPRRRRRGRAGRPLRLLASTAPASRGAGTGAPALCAASPPEAAAPGTARRASAAPAGGTSRRSRGGGRSAAGRRTERPGARRRPRRAPPRRRSTWTPSRSETTTRPPTEASECVSDCQPHLVDDLLLLLLLLPDESGEWCRESQRALTWQSTWRIRPKAIPAVGFGMVGPLPTHRCELGRCRPNNPTRAGPHLIDEPSIRAPSHKMGPLGSPIWAADACSTSSSPIGSRWAALRESWATFSGPFREIA